MYSKGQGVSADPTQAHMWADLSTQSAKGIELTEAVKLRDSLEARLTAGQLSESKRLSAEWITRPKFR